jgi:hypothetical protein
MSAELKRLHEAISAVQAMDLEALGPSDRHELTVGLFTETSRLTAARSRVVQAWETTAAWAVGGALSPSHRLAHCCRLPIGAARSEVARARQRQTMPGAHAALADGRIGVDHLRLLGGANRPSRAAAYQRDEAMLVGFCAASSFLVAQQAIEYWCQRVDAAGVEAEATERGERNRVHLSQSLDGCWFLDGFLDPVAGTIVDNELHRLAEQVRLEDERAGITRTPAQRRAAALVRMAERSAAKPKGARRARVLAHVYVGEDSLVRLCELGNGAVLAPGQLVPYLDRLAFDTLLFDAPSTVVSVTHTRTFTGAVRSAVVARDRRCQHPSGCNTPAERGDVDHIVPYAAGGSTSQFNGRVQCAPHNRLAHLHGDPGEPLPHRPLSRLDELSCRVRHHLRRRDPADASDTSDTTWRTIRIRGAPTSSDQHRRRGPPA